MGGFNTTGKARTSDYFVGRGRLSASLLDANDDPVGGWFELGNLTQLALDPQVDSVEHKSTLTGLSETDAEIIFGLETTVEFVTEELNFTNLAVHSRGLTGNYTNPTDSVSVGNYLLSDDGDFTSGRYYDVYSTDVDGTETERERCYDIGNWTFTVEYDPTGAFAGSEVTLVKDTDYEVDEDFGRIFVREIMPTVANASQVVQTGALRYVLSSAGSGATATLDEVRALQDLNLTVALNFIGENPQDDNERFELRIHKVLLSPSQALNLITTGQELGNMGFTGRVQVAENRDSSSPYYSIRTFKQAA